MVDVLQRKALGRVWNRADQGWSNRQQQIIRGAAREAVEQKKLILTTGTMDMVLSSYISLVVSELCGQFMFKNEP